ncbi:MAG: glycosyltransferase [Bacteroidetes bacterium]|nr:glycosyltransferase [Bacteroidota bacterium]
MKVLHVSSEASWRGGEQQMAYLISESIKAGVEIRVLLRTGSAFEDWAKKERVSYEAISFAFTARISEARKLKRLSEGVDLIHVHSGKSHDLLVMSYLLGAKTPSILSRRVDFPPKGNLWSRYKYRHPLIKKVLCVSEAIRAMVIPILKTPEQAITVHSGVDLSRYEGLERKGVLRTELGLGAQQKLIGIVAALAPHKDLFTFISSCSTLKKEGLNARYVIIGEGDLRKQLEAYANEMGLKDELTFLGFRKDALTLIPDLDVFLITSKTEGLGTSIIDAMASGVPVVATAAGGIPELVKHGETGIICPVGNVKALADGVKRMLSSKEEREGMIKGAKAHIQSFSYQHTAETTLKVYEEVLSSGL